MSWTDIPGDAIHDGLWFARRARNASKRPILRFVAPV